MSFADIPLVITDQSNTNVLLSVSEHGTLTVPFLRVEQEKTPATPTSNGTVGEISWDSSYVYVCVAANTWKRIQLNSW